MGPLVHLRMTEQWLVEAGLDGDVAHEIARCDVRYDMEHPGSLGLMNSTRHLGPSARVWARIHLRRAKRTGSPCEFGRALHCIQDAESHGLLGLSHIRHRLGLLRRDPDDWEAAPDALKRRVRRATDRYVRFWNDVGNEAGGAA